MLSQFFVYVCSKRFRLVGRVGNAQSIADRISGSRTTTRMWQELAEKEFQLIGFHTTVCYQNITCTY